MLALAYQTILVYPDDLYGILTLILYPPILQDSTHHTMGNDHAFNAGSNFTCLDNKKVGSLGKPNSNSALIPRSMAETNQCVQISVV